MPINSKRTAIGQVLVNGPRHQIPLPWPPNSYLFTPNYGFTPNETEAVKAETGLDAWISFNEPQDPAGLLPANLSVKLGEMFVTQPDGTQQQIRLPSPSPFNYGIGDISQLTASPANPAAYFSWNNKTITYMVMVLGQAVHPVGSVSYAVTVTESFLLFRVVDVNATGVTTEKDQLIYGEWLPVSSPPGFL
jgi:hypothetical protein